MADSHLSRVQYEDDNGVRCEMAMLSCGHWLYADETATGTNDWNRLHLEMEMNVLLHGKEGCDVDE